MSNARPSTIWFTRCPVPTASGIAVTNGWLRQRFGLEGIEFGALRSHADVEIRRSHFTHSLENSFRQGGNAPALHARACGAETRLIGLQWTRQYQAILARGPRSLRGAVIGVPLRPGPEIDFWRATAVHGISHVLAQEGLDLDAVTIRWLEREESYFAPDPGDVGDAASVDRIARLHLTETVALLRDEVEAIFAYGAWGEALRGQFGLSELARLSADAGYKGQANNEQPTTLTVSAALLDTQPDLVDAYVVEVLRAADWAKASPQAANQILARELAVSEYWLNRSYGDDIAQRLDVDLTPELMDGLIERKDFLRDHGYLPADFDVASWVDTGPLTRARALYSACAAKEVAA